MRAIDPTTGKMSQIPLGDVVADNGASVVDFVGFIIGSVNPVLGLMAAGACGLLFAGARRKKKPVV